ncbi:MAG: DUF5683 domain-containing protein, partial [Bacteroidia bacterium]|nr:DUF5683 domain-containing protein [Bacteroidia bacterium]
MKTKTISIVALFFLLFHYVNIAQTADTSQLKLNHTHKPHNRLFKINISSWSEPKKAGVLSAILPGAGQIYNKKYWKAPVIYLAGGVLVFNTIHQNNNYLYFKKELINVLNGKMNENGYSAQQLTLLKNQSKKWRDLSIAGIVLVY